MIIPKSIDEVAAEWLQNVLSASFPSSEFRLLAQKRIGAEFGFASEIYRLAWGGDSSAVIKLWDTSKAGKKEIHFYKHFADCGARVPHFFYGASDPKSQRAVLLLEDLAEATQGDVLELLNLERAKAVAQNLAKLHAKSIGDPILKTLPWINDVSIWEPKPDWVKSRRSRFFERFPNRLSGTAIKVLNQLESAPQIANDRLQHAPQTLLHGDFHLDNIMFEGGIESVFLDWSRPDRGPLALNLGSLLFDMIELDQFDTVLDHYLEQFHARASIRLKKDEVEHRLGGAFLRRFSAVTCGSAMWEPALPRAVKMINEAIDRANKLAGFWEDRDPALFAFLSNRNH